MADAMRGATEAGYAAVGEPVEGTMLTVAGPPRRRREVPAAGPPATC